MADLSDYWPKAVAHLGNPLCAGDSKEITVAEISEAPVNGYRGFRKATTALVPLERLDEVLKHPGSMGHEVQSWGRSHASARVRHTARAFGLTAGKVLMTDLKPSFRGGSATIVWSQPGPPNALFLMAATAARRLKMVPLAMPANLN